MNDDARTNAAEYFNLGPADVSVRHVEVMIDHGLVADTASDLERDNYAWAGGQGSMTTAKYIANERERDVYIITQKARLAVEYGLQLHNPARHRTAPNRSVPA